MDRGAGPPPEQAVRWTWLLIAAYVQLRLARSLAPTCAAPGNGGPAPDSR